MTSYKNDITHLDFEAVAEVLKLDVQVLFDGELSVWDGLMQVGAEIRENLRRAEAREARVNVCITVGVVIRRKTREMQEDHTHTECM